MSEPKLADPENPAAPKGALGIIFLIIFSDFLGFGIIIPLLPFYVPDYKQHALQVTLLFSIYSICQFIGAPILGALSDKVGRRPVLIVSQLGSAAGYILLGIATLWKTSNPQLVLMLVYLSRIIDGFTGGNVSTAQAYISDVTPPKDRAKGMGLIGAAFGIGFSVGPFIGGFVGHYNKSAPAYIAAGFAALAALITFLRLPESRVHKPVDVEAWLHPSRFTPVLRRPVVFQLLMISFLSMAAFVMMEATVALFLAAKYNYGEKKVGLFFAFIGVIIAGVQGGLIGRLTKKFGEWPLAIIGPILVAAGMVLYMETAWHSVLWLLLCAGAINAAGRSFQMPPISSLISKFSDPREQGVTFGLFHGLGSIARVIGPLIAGIAYPYMNNTGQFLVGGIIVLVAGVWTIALARSNPAPQVDRSAESRGFPVVEIE